MTKQLLLKRHAAKILDFTEVTDPFEVVFTGRYRVTLNSSYSWDGTSATSYTCRCFDSLRSADYHLRRVKLLPAKWGMGLSNPI